MGTISREGVRKRPRGETILAMLLMIASILSLSTLLTYGVLGLARVVLYMVAAIGLLKLKNWARLLTIGIMWANFAFAIVTIIGMVSVSMQYGFSPQLTMLVSYLALALVVALIFAVIITWYLTKPNVESAFKLKPVTPTISTTTVSETKPTTTTYDSLHVKSIETPTIVFTVIKHKNSRS